MYDGLNTATILPANLAGAYAGDAVTVSATSATYADKNAGTGKLVTVSGMALNGIDAANYVLDQTSTSANVGVISARTVAVGTTGNGVKTYDGGTTLDAAHLGSLAFTLANGDTVTQNLLLQDSVALDASAVSGLLGDRNAGTGKGVTLSGYTLGNNAAGNYVLANGAVQGLANVAKAVLTLTTGLDSRVYDGTTTSTGAVAITGLVGGDAATATQAFDSKNAGSRNLVVTGYTVGDGNSGDNYSIVNVATAGSIAQKQLSGSLTGSIGKMYDGSAAATILATNLGGVIAG